MAKKENINLISSAPSGTSRIIDAKAAKPLGSFMLPKPVPATPKN